MAGVEAAELPTWIVEQRVYRPSRLPVAALVVGRRGDGAIRAATGWRLGYDDEPVADRPFGAYYHWCALLCGLSEAALEHGLLSTLQLDAIRRDLEVSLPGLRACRDVLVVIPGSLKEDLRLADLLRDDEMLGRLRRLHHAFGEALREEQMSRELDLLDP